MKPSDELPPMPPRVKPAPVVRHYEYQMPNETVVTVRLTGIRTIRQLQFIKNFVDLIVEQETELLS